MKKIVNKNLYTNCNMLINVDNSVEKCKKPHK